MSNQTDAARQQAQHDHQNNLGHPSPQSHGSDILRKAYEAERSRLGQADRSKTGR